MRKKYYGIALLVFIALMALMYGGSMLISFEVVIGGILLAGERGIDMAYNFLMDYPNFFSIAVYLIPTSIMLPWYYFAFIEKKADASRTYKTAFPHLLRVGCSAYICSSACYLSCHDPCRSSGPFCHE